MKFDIYHLFSPRHAKALIIALVAVLLLLISVQWLSLLWTDSPLPVSPAVQQVEAPVKQEASSQKAITALFGVYMSDDLNNIKESMLNVSLVGILYADKIEQSQVIIRSASGEENTYQIGDLIPGNALLKRITATGVLVEHNGAIESLTLPKSDLTFEPAAQPLIKE